MGTNEWGRTYSPWRAIATDGTALDHLIWERRNQEVAGTVLRWVVDGYPEEMI
jgi:transposase-like protein